jgi:hypothetical protein
MDRNTHEVSMIDAQSEAHPISQRNHAAELLLSLEVGPAENLTLERI